MERQAGWQVVGNGRKPAFRPSEVEVGGTARVGRGLPRQHQAGDQVGCPWGCGGVVVVAGEAQEGSLDAAVRAGRSSRRRRRATEATKGLMTRLRRGGRLTDVNEGKTTHDLRWRRGA